MKYISKNGASTFRKLGTTISLVCLASLLAVASEKKPETKTIALLGQYHLSGKTITTDIEASKKLPQFNNQKSIYLVIDEWVKQKKLNLLISEGCEGEINQDFKTVFNGWDYSSLKKLKESKSFKDVLSLVPLKIEAKYDEAIKTVCGDNQLLIKEHQLIFSDLKGYVGFFSRLKQSQPGTKMYLAYLQALEESEKKKIAKPIEYLKKKILNIIDEHTRECLLSLVKRRINSQDVILALADLFLQRGMP
jgi:hypothetical protein